MDEVPQERLDDAWDEGFAHGYSRGNEEGLKIAFKDGYDFGAKTVSAKFVAEIEQLRQVLRQITELSPFKFNTGHASLQYITQMLIEMTALAHETLKEKE